MLEKMSWMKNESTPKPNPKQFQNKKANINNVADKKYMDKKRNNSDQYRLLRGRIRMVQTIILKMKEV